MHQKALLDAILDILNIWMCIAHCIDSNIESKADHEVHVGGKAAPIDNVLLLDLECSRVVNLLEITGKVAKVIVLPLDEAADLVGKLGVGHIVASLIHGALVAALEGWRR